MTQVLPLPSPMTQVLPSDLVAEYYMGRVESCGKHMQLNSNTVISANCSVAHQQQCDADYARLDAASVATISSASLEECGMKLHVARGSMSHSVCDVFINGAIYLKVLIDMTAANSCVSCARFSIITSHQSRQQVRKSGLR